MDEQFEECLKVEARPLLMSGRGGDWEHTQRAVGYGRYLLAREILRELGCDHVTVRAVAEIIAVHDEPKKVFAKGDPLGHIGGGGG
ncbi:MAG: hypothetical protein ACLFUE_06055 [Desulfobacteraceae bacterium]